MTVVDVLNHDGPVAMLVVWDHDAGGYVPATKEFCTARWASKNFHPRRGEVCGREASERVGDVWVCDHHYRRALNWHHEEIGRENRANREFDIRQKLRHEEEMRRWDATGSQIVYYVRRTSDGLIKIGTSTNTAQRMAALRQQHGELQLLLTHCGDFAREQEMHERFVETRVSGEWFLPSEPLLRWIAGGRRKHVNARTRIDGTVPMKVILALLAELHEDAA